MGLSIVSHHKTKEEAEEFKVTFSEEVDVPLDDLHIYNEPDLDKEKPWTVNWD